MAISGWILKTFLIMYTRVTLQNQCVFLFQELLADDFKEECEG